MRASVSGVGSLRPPSHIEGVGRPSPFARTAYSIMGRVAAAMRDAGIDQSEIDDYLKRAMAGDYDNLLKVGMETVDVSFS